MKTTRPIKLVKTQDRLFAEQWSINRIADLSDTRHKTIRGSTRPKTQKPAPSDNSKVTVIMPCYNHAKYVGAAIESVLNQTYRNIEVLLIDNVSTDGTKEIIADFAKKDKRVRPIFHKKNIGYEGSINEGFNKATGAYIALTSSDDIWYPEKLKTQMDALDSNPSCDIVHAGARLIDGEGKPRGKNIAEFYRVGQAELSGDVFYAMTRRNICCTSTVLFKKKCLKTCGQFDLALKYAHDWWFYIQLAKKHKFLYVNKVLADYRIHSTNLTRNRAIVYGDYYIIHSRLARLGIEPKRHLIAAGFAAAVLGKKSESLTAIEDAKTRGPLAAQDRLTAFIIEKFGDKPDLLLSINEKRHLLLGFLYGLMRRS